MIFRLILVLLPVGCAPTACHFWPGDTDCPCADYAAVLEAYYVRSCRPDQTGSVVRPGSSRVVAGRNAEGGPPVLLCSCDGEKRDADDVREGPR